MNEQITIEDAQKMIGELIAEYCPDCNSRLYGCQYDDCKWCDCGWANNQEMIDFYNSLRSEE